MSNIRSPMIRSLATKLEKLKSLSIDEYNKVENKAREIRTQIEILNPRTNATSYLQINNFLKKLDDDIARISREIQTKKVQSKREIPQAAQSVSAKPEQKNSSSSEFSFASLFCCGHSKQSEKDKEIEQPLLSDSSHTSIGSRK
jgi:hypothetical protein